MGRHYRRRDSLTKSLLKLVLLAIVSFALLFVVFRLYPDKFTSPAARRVGSICNEAAILGSKAVGILGKGGDGSGVVHGTAAREEKTEVSLPESKDAVVSEDKLKPSEQEMKPIMAIVVDDGGNDLRMAQKVSSLDIPLTWAILPYTRYAKETASTAENSKVPYLLHLPMQAEIDKDPKEYLVGEGMDRQSIRNVTQKALDSLPSPIGINNHRGSLATSKWDIMVPVIDVLKEKGLCFLDSRTSGKSVAYEVAKAAGITSFRNRGFLDGTPDKDSIKARFDQAVKTAVKRGDLIVICHFRPATLLFLEALNREYRQLPVRLVTLPEMAAILSKRHKSEEE